jgi:hypothetical protein
MAAFGAADAGWEGGEDPAADGFLHAYAHEEAFGSALGHEPGVNQRDDVCGGVTGE